MQVGHDTVVALEYELSDTDGRLIEKTTVPFEYLHGGYDGIFPTVEKELQGKNAGDTCRVKLSPADAFGEYEAELVHLEPKDKFPETVTVGMQFEGVGEASGETLVYTITDIADDKVVVDGNHPLAGQSLNFSCTVASVRAATGEEITHGHVHGGHGHHD